MIKRISVILLLALSMGCQGPGHLRGGKGDASGADFIARLDLDKDGKVSATEFDGPAEHFTKLDANADGFLSEEEAPSGPPPGGRRR